MRIVYFGNNRVGVEVLAWLREQGEELAALVVHPRDEGRHLEELRAAAGLPDDRIWSAPELDDPHVVEALAALEPNLGLSVFFGYILRSSVLGLFPAGVVNLHPSYLPFNRGAHPNVWSLVEGTPAGTSLHYVDEGVDTGDVIARRQVEVEPVDTGKTLYRKLEAACVDLFRDTWPRLREGRVEGTPQAVEEGTVHRKADLESLDRIDLDRSYTGREMVNILRARTFPPYPGAFFVHEGRRVHVRLSLEYGDEEP